MAMTRRNTSRRKLRARRTRKRSYNIARPRYNGGRVLRVTKKFWYFSWTLSVATTNDFWRYWAVGTANIPEINSMRDLFESYKINWIEYEMRPRYDNFAGNDTTDTTLPGVTNQGGCDVHICVDPKNTVTPTGTYNSTTLNNFLCSGRVKTYKGHQPIKFRIKYPCVRDDINGVATQKAVRATWYDMSSQPSHYGAHVFISDVNQTGTFGQSYDVFCTINISLKGQR